MNNKFFQRIIDFHAHVFPEKIVDKALVSISEFYGIKMTGGGTAVDLLESGSKVNVDKYVIHSTATKAEQVAAVNQFIKKVKDSSDKFIGFGTLHPDFENMEDEFEKIRSFGLKGIKLHPEFQSFAIDDPSMMKIYSLCEGKLPILMHMGDDRGDSSSPARLVRVIEKFPRLVFIAAHLGGYRMWKESCELLAGKNIYFDTSSSLAFLSIDEALKLIRKHGADKVLFGSDYPMWDYKEELNRFNALPLDDDEKENILWKNAASLLGIK